MKILLLLFFLLLIPTISAIDINHTTSKITVTRNVLLETPITIKNTEPFIIYNLTFTSIAGFSFPAFPQIQPNETITKNIIINTQSAFNEIKPTTVSFFYITTTTTTPQTKTVNIDTSTLSPSNITIRKGDTIAWKNLNSITTFTVKKTDESESNPVPPNQQFLKTFPNEGIYEYYIAETGLIGRINIITNIVDSFTHDTGKDKTINFDIESKNPSASLSAENLITSFSMNYNGIEQGAIKLSSDGEVFGVTLSAEPGWIAFHQNHFDFNKTKIVTYDIKPFINKTEQTNKSYSINVSIITENTGHLSGLISVFILHSNDIVPNSTEFDDKITFCTDAQIISLCTRFPDQCPKKEVIVEKLIEKNDTEITLLRETSNKLDRLTNAIKLVENEEGNTKLQTIDGKIDSVVTSFEEFKADYQQGKKNKSLLWIFIILGILVVGGIIGTYIAHRWWNTWLKNKNRIIQS